MIRKYCRIAFVLMLLFSGKCLQAQLTTVKGSLLDTTSQSPVYNAVVSVLSAKDSVLIKFVRSRKDGTFELNNIPSGKNILTVMHPQYADYVDEINVQAADQKIPSISLTSKSKLLSAVIVKSGGAFRIKGDTTIYTADSFKVAANANVEELLKKLPGIQVDKKGDIRAMGEKVEIVLVDGEEFFGDDPGMAVKNLKADAVKEVQVFDKKSDQAAFTGIDDGKTKKTINLSLKEDRKQGYFGKLGIAGGKGENIPDRFNDNMMFGSFKGKRKLSAFLLNGNTGQDGLSWQDSEKYGGQDDGNFEMFDEDGMFSFNSAQNSNDEEPVINTENGFIRNINSGIQYTNKWNDKIKLNYTPRYNLQDYNNYKTVSTKTDLGDSTLNDFSTTTSNVKRYNIKNNLILDIKIDSNNSLKIVSKANYYHTENIETTISETSGSLGTLKNTSERDINSHFDKQAYGTNALFKHKFKKQRRTISVLLDWNALKSDGYNFLNSENQTYDGLNAFKLDVDQKINNDRLSQSFSSKIIYTEPINKKFSFEISHEISYNTSNNNQTTFAYSDQTKEFDNLIDTLSNDFNQKVTINKPGGKISYNFNKIKFNFGSGFGITHYNFLDKTMQQSYIRDFTNFFPTATFVYTYKSNHALRLTYNGYTSQPTINQLQPLRNNNNPFNEYIGNPDLDPSFTNNFNLFQNTYDFIKDRYTYASVNVSFTNNSFTNNRIIDPVTGKTTTQPINTNGNVSVSMYTGTGFKLKKTGIKIYVGPNGSFTRFADIINSNLSFSNNVSGGLTVNFSKSKDKKYDISINNDLSYNYNKNAQSSYGSHFYTNYLSLKATVYYKKVWSINSEYQFYARQKSTDKNYNFNNHIWNAQIQRTFKNDEFTVFFRARDLLNQNIGFYRSYYSNTYTEEVDTRLKRYFMLGFSWDFKNK